jgi:hypothetical protein
MPCSGPPGTHEAVDPQPLAALEAADRRVRRPVDVPIRAVLRVLVAAERAERPLGLLHVVLAVGAAVADLVHEATEDVGGAAQRPSEQSKSHHRNFRFEV